MEPADPDDVAADTEGTVAGTVELSDGGSLPVTLDADLAERAREEGVDVEQLHAAAVPSSATVDLTAQTDGDSTSTIPVQDHQETDLTNRLRRDRDHRFIEDDQVQRLIRNSVNYTERVGRFLMDRDDLIPTVKERIKSLIVGEDGLTVEPADPDDDADQRLADHLEDAYRDDVQPGEVIDRILRENLMNARAVLRATDLKELDLNTLDYLRDGVSGEEIYVQDETTVYEFSVDDDGDTDVVPGIDLERKTVDAQPLIIGDHVFDISLYDTPPLEAVADTAVNKMVLQRLKARKAEITSFGAVYAKVEPPSYLPEDQYFDRVDDDDWNGEGEPPTKLERALKSNIQSAFDTLKDFQSGTVMSVPDFWTLEQLEIPETGEALDDQIRGYNRDISRRLLVPLDLIELQSGSELSRETMFRTLMTTIAGWRKEIIRIFDQYADIQAEIEGLDDGEVTHQFPPLKDANTQQIVSALQYAGPAGLSQKEVRKMMNAIQGVDLDTDMDQGGPPAGGPDGGQERQEQMEQMLEQQRRGQDDADQEPADGPPAPDQDDPPGPEADATASGGGQGNVNRAGGAGPEPAAQTTAAQDGSDGPAPTGRAAEILDAVPFLPDADGDGPVRIPSDRLKDWLAWVRAGRPSLEADWNPTLHPRGPDGAFVERPYDIPDEIQDEIDDLSTPETLDRLAGTSELSDDDLDALLGDGGVRIDGIPDDASSRQDLREAADSGGGGIAPGTALSEVDESDVGPDLTETGVDQLEPGDTVAVDDTVGEVKESNLKFLRVDRGDGAETLPTIDHTIRPIQSDVMNDGDAGTSDAQEAMADAGYASPDAPDMRVSEADSVEPFLDDPEGSAGSAASNMDVARFDDGTTAFVKRYRDDVDGPRSDGENPTNAEREVAADTFLRNVGMDDHLPGLFDNQEEGYAASEKIDGDEARLNTPGGAAEVDEDEFKDFAAAAILAGNSDLHGDNWRVQDDGSFYAIDLNKAGGDFTEDGKFRRRGRNMITGVADTIGVDLDADELTERATELAQEIDTEAALDGVPNSDLSDADRHQFRDNIQDNIEAFAAGEVDL